MTTKIERVYWDSCAYISCIEQTPNRGPLLAKIAEAAERGEIVFIASTLVLAEVVKIDDPSLAAEQQAQKIRDFFDNDYIKVKDVSREISVHAAEIARTHGLKPHDAIHVATALRWECSCLQTYDGEKGEKRKLLAFDGKIRLPGKPPLKICVPYLPPGGGGGRAATPLFPDE